MENEYEVVVVLNEELKIVLRKLDELIVFIEDLIIVSYDEIKVFE